MQILVQSYLRARYRFFEWCESLNAVEKLFLAVCMAVVTGLMAQVRVHLPWTPVPITGQTLAVLLSGVLLGVWGGISQAIYVGLGAFGIPWFSGWKGGVGCIIGPTGGYLIGFILAAFFVGYIIDRFSDARRLSYLLALMFAANFVFIHVPGLLQLNLWYRLVEKTVPSVSKLLVMGSLPFIPGDIVKIIVAAILANVLVPQRVITPRSHR